MSGAEAIPLDDAGATLLPPPPTLRDMDHVTAGEVRALLAEFKAEIVAAVRDALSDAVIVSDRNLVTRVSTLEAWRKTHPGGP